MATQAPAMTDEQAVAHGTLLKFITGEDKTYTMMTFTGYAGTGKTFTLVQLVASLRTLNNSGGGMFGDHNYRIAMSAPTHKAVRVMKKFARGMAGVTFATIHSLLGLKEVIDHNGKQKFEVSKDPDQIRITQFNVLFIDEVSMLADELFKLVRDHAARSGLKVIFVGDPKQIPPVNHLDAIPLIPAQRSVYKIGLVSLETIMRQSMDNPILALATRIRKAEKTTENFQVEQHTIQTADMLEEPKGIITPASTDEAGIRIIFNAHFDCEKFRQDADHMKVICWRNATVDAFNKIIRGQLYANVPLPEGITILPFIMVGEKLIVDKPVILENNKVLLTTNEEIEVLSYELKETEVRYLMAEMVNREWVGKQETFNVRYYNTVVRYFDEDGDEAECNIRILHEDDQAKIAAATKKIADTANLVTYGNILRSKLWYAFYGLQRKFAAVKYNYAITAHKSQGSTYENCMVIDWDFGYNKNIEERNRIRYVGVTRSRTLLYFVK